jgi:exodeoxyribonuclease V alpha subunit
MITRNDHARGLTNGDIGVVMAQYGGGYQVFFNRSGSLTSIPAARLSDWDLAFAMTVHKSQGAEFEDALLVLPDDPLHRLLTREIIYTAATRAARSLIIYGAASAFQTALQRKIVRQSGLILKSKSSIR